MRVAVALALGEQDEASRLRRAGAGPATPLAYRDGVRATDTKEHETSMTLRAATPADHPRLLELNAASVLELSPLDDERLSYILALAERCLVVDNDAGEVVGFAIAIPPGTEYDSINYGWFSARYERFLYLDRIAVSAACRRQRIGARLYDAMEQAAAPYGRMVCDVNIQPRNEASLAFHAARGYHELGELAHPAGKTVALLSNELESA
jgi:predicted GNAT superfamily acetyltransferase